MIPRPTLPTSLFSALTWTDTGKATGTFSAAQVAVNQHRQFGFRKPGRFVPAGLEAAREVIASYIGRWLEVDISTVELLPPVAGVPCCVSWAIPGIAVIPYGQVIRAPFVSPAYKAKAVASLPRLGRAIVLDALLGNCDRWNDGNILYVESEDRWYSIDYSLAFNRHHPAGVGDPKLAYGADPSLRQLYFPEILAAIRLSPLDFQRTVGLAESIADDEIDHLFHLLPPSHASAADAGLMKDFVKERRSSIRGILQRWTTATGLGGTI